ncbi:MAG: protein kinase [Myxococcales bacterium]|nr:protein kinase [Myxococcales bacterium]
MSDTKKLNTPTVPSGPKANKRKSIKALQVDVAPERIAADGASNAPNVKDKFDLHGLLGEGGMGSVFVAQDRRLGRVVALKVLRSELGGDADLVRRFALEAQVGAQLEHPNIVPLYSLELSESGAPAFAMQLVEGMTLAQYMRDAAFAPEEERKPQGQYALKKRLDGLLGACSAMEFAHSRGVIHRDLKPDNIMLGDHREVYVMDWGLARVTTTGVEEDDEISIVELGPSPTPSTFGSAPTVAPSASKPPVDSDAFAGAPTAVPSHTPPATGSSPERHTQYGQVMGTFQYMAPEQAQGRIDEVGPAADQYALGLMLLELGTLRPARSTISSSDAHKEAMAGRTGSTEDCDGNELPAAFLAIVRRATAKTVSDRYASVTELAEDVRRFIRDEEVSVYREGLARRLARAAARRPAFFFGVLSAICTAGGVAIMVSLVLAAQTARRAASDLEGLQKVLVATQQRGQEIDVHLSDLSAALERVAAVTLETMAREEGRVDDAALAALAAQPMPPLQYSDRHQTNVNWTTPTISWVGRPAQPPPPSTLVLSRVAPWLRGAGLSSLPGEFLDAPPAEQDAALERGNSAWIRVGVGLADGAYMQFPGREMPEGYDHRERSWYRAALQHHTLQWAAPNPSPLGKGLRLPALLALTREGKVVGVVVGDVNVEEFAQRLVLSEMPGFVDAYLCTSEGKITVRRGLAAQEIKPGMDLEKPLELPQVTDEELARRMAAREFGGYLKRGDRLVVFSQLISPPWYYVAEFERGPYLSTAQVSE